MNDYDSIIPEGILFSLREVENMKIIKIDMAKKLIAKNQLTFVKVGAKVFLSRLTLRDYLQDNTIEACK